MCSFMQIAFAYDVVALENASRLVTGHLHRHAFGHAGPHEVSNSRPPKIVHESARQPRFDARRFPCSLESFDRPAAAVENLPANSTGFPQFLRFCSLSLQERT